MKFEPADLQGIGQGAIAVLTAFVTDAPDIDIREAGDAGFLRQAAIDQDARGAGVEQKCALASVDLKAETEAAQVLRVRHNE